VTLNGYRSCKMLIHKTPNNKVSITHDTWAKVTTVQYGG
jgi:hypothetical protein